MHFQSKVLGLVPLSNNVGKLLGCPSSCHLRIKLVILRDTCYQNVKPQHVTSDEGGYSISVLKILTATGSPHAGSNSPGRILNLFHVTHSREKKRMGLLCTDCASHPQIPEPQQNSKKKQLI